MTHVSVLHKASLVEMREPAVVRAVEVQSLPQAVRVTLELPERDQRDLGLLVTPWAVLVLSRSRPSEVVQRIPLPAFVDPDRYVARELNGVIEVLIERAHRSH